MDVSHGPPMIHECKHCGKNLNSFKAIRINGSAYIEQFINNTPIRVWKERHNIPKEQWGSAYEEYARDAAEMTEAMNRSAEEIRGGLGGKVD